jgi:hypothetical protein
MTDALKQRQGELANVNQARGRCAQKMVVASISIGCWQYDALHLLRQRTIFLSYTHTYCELSRFPIIICGDSHERASFSLNSLVEAKVPTPLLPHREACLDPGEAKRSWLP